MVWTLGLGIRKSFFRFSNKSPLVSRSVGYWAKAHGAPPSR